MRFPQPRLLLLVLSLTAGALMIPSRWLPADVAEVGRSASGSLEPAGRPALRL